MGQITAETIKMVRAALERNEPPPLTAWEYEQLCRAWEQVQPAEQVGIEVARLMRWIDGYAFDYTAEGKLSTSRLLVEKELTTALASSAPQQPVSAETCERVIKAVQSVFGGQTGNSNLAEWANQKQRAHEAIRTALSPQQAEQGGK